MAENSGVVESVEVSMKDSGADAPDQAETDAVAAELVDGVAPVEPALPSEPKPEGEPPALPEGVESVEDLIAKYNEIQSGKPAADKAPDALDIAKPAPDDARSLTEAAGLNYDELSATFAETGELPDEAYEAFAKQNIGRNLVNQFLSSQIAAIAAFRTESLSKAEITNFDEISGWAMSNMTDAQLAAYNSEVNSNDPERVILALRGLKATFQAANGSAPNLATPGSAQASSRGDKYESTAQMVADMDDPRYEIDPAYRAKVEAKISRSDDVLP